MTQLERIASAHRVAVKRDACNDPIVPGNNGHLYTDDGAVMVCFTDDGRKKAFTSQFKTYRLQMLRKHFVRLKQEGDCEFIAQIEDSPVAIEVALFRVLKVKRLRVDRGIPRPIPEGLQRVIASKRDKAPKSDSSSVGASWVPESET